MLVTYCRFYCIQSSFYLFVFHIQLVATLQQNFYIPWTYVINYIQFSPYISDEGYMLTCPVPNLDLIIFKLGLDLSL